MTDRSSVYDKIVGKGIGTLHYDVDGSPYIIVDTQGTRYMVSGTEIKAFGDYGTYDVKEGEKEFGLLADFVDGQTPSAPHHPAAIEIPPETARFLIGLPPSLIDQIAGKPECWGYIAEGRTYQGDDVMRPILRQFHQPWAAYQLARAKGEEVRFGRYTVWPSGRVEHRVSEKQMGKYLGKGGSKLAESEAKLRALGLAGGLRYIPSSLGDDDEEEMG